MIDPRGSREQIADGIRRASERVLTARRDVVAHHLSKGAIENWFTFELAAELDLSLARAGGAASNGALG